MEGRSIYLSDPELAETQMEDKANRAQQRQFQNDGTNGQ
jgi:hypothetical protein